jgi:hypothetical protein
MLGDGDAQDDEEGRRAASEISQRQLLFSVRSRNRKARSVIISPEPRPRGRRSCLIEINRELGKRTPLILMPEELP